VYLPLAEVVEHGTALLDNLEQCELVCLDDLDAVAGNREWEEALFHLFNRLRDSGRRLLLAAATSPRELPMKLPDLHSRLTLALVFQLQSLSDEDKLRALQLRASRRGLHLSDEVGRFILTRGERSISHACVAVLAANTSASSVRRNSGSLGRSSMVQRARVRSSTKPADVARWSESHASSCVQKRAQ
jgi:DnaA regulatory inactivator Hda